MADASLVSRLDSLQQQYKQALTLIQRLQKLPAIPGTYSTSENGKDPRVDLSSEIHSSLKEQESEFETLRQEVEDEFQPMGRWVGGGSVRRRNEGADADRERILAQVSRLGEDLKSARASFRRAQLDAKKNVDQARRRERELLFAGARSADGTSGGGELHPARRRGQEKLSEDELALDASNDVTVALRRTHDLMQAQLEQSTFAQQTLEESSAALKGLDESYSNLSTLLNSSKTLVKGLISTQKSDSQYLWLAIYTLLLTLTWLVLRRILWGPLWLLIWQPVKLGWWLLFTIMSAVGMTGVAQTSVPAASSATTSLHVPPQATGGPPPRQEFQQEGSYMVVGGGGKGGGWGHNNIPPHQTVASSPKGEDGRSVVDEIGQMAEKRVEAQPGTKGTNINDISEEEKSRQEEMPRNPKKRMWEHGKEEVGKDEL